MLLTHYFSLNESRLQISERQGSNFAKAVAGDFNPLHDEGSKRFCIPGDLLFSILLHHYGVHAETNVQFAGMLDADDAVILPPLHNGHVHLLDTRERHCVSLFTSGERTHDDAFCQELTTAYVRFSGQTFPDILVEMMREHAVMINPDRPMVIYKDMAFRLSHMSGRHLTLVPAQHEISVNGKKGSVRLRFIIKAEGRQIGEGEKNMVLSGLRPFDESAMQTLIERYDATRSSWQVPAE